MSNKRRSILEGRLEKAMHRTVDHYVESLSLDRADKGQEAERARSMADRWQHFQKKLGRMIFY